jgi:uncharacterized protein (DUF362 family)
MNLTRRQWFTGVGAGVAASSKLALSAQVASKSERTKLSIPGLYRGKVVAVNDPKCIVSGAFQAEPIQRMIRTGMMKLTGAPDAKSAWSQFVEPGDVVGIKLNPVGKPHVMSSPETVREVIAGLNSAGIKNKDIVVYDRYRKQFMDAGYDKWLPEGVRMSHAAEDYMNVQLDMDGYDPEHYMEMALTLPQFDIDNVAARRSYAALFITKQVNKLINLPVLKDHQSAGITLALKNLSHGLVNNVSRSHGTTTLNACGAFIPAVVSMPVIRNKVVLNILDGTKGLYHGGPGARPQFVWEHQTMYFATDPVALDRIGWQAIDAKRASIGMKPIAEDLPDKFSTFERRQPEHVEIAGALGLGEWNLGKIKVERVDL